MPLFLNRNRPLAGRCDAPPHEGPFLAMMRPSVLGTDGVVTVHVEASALGEEAGLREVWLLNVDGTRMV